MGSSDFFGGKKKQDVDDLHVAKQKMSNMYEHQHKVVCSP